MGKGGTVMGTRRKGDGPLPSPSSYCFPTHLVRRKEDDGADFVAFRAEKKINSAEHFNEELEGRPAMRKVSSGFFRVVNSALAGMKSSNKK